MLTALNAVQAAEVRSRGREDRRSPAQRRADGALGEVCRRCLDVTDRPVVGGERPHVTVTVPVEALAGVSERAAEMDHVGPASAEVARLLSCDASLMRIVLAAPSEPLDVGRRTPVIPASLRRAVIVRDRHCLFPGCDRHTWCDAHHITHWANGGATRLDNLLLLCRRHHRMVHRAGFGLGRRDGRPVFTRPDGPELQADPLATDRAPP